jgi:hypothetical protein
MKPNTHQSLGRGLQVLEAVASSGGKASLTEAARQRLKDLREPILDYAQSLSTRFGWTDAATVAIQ